MPKGFTDRSAWEAIHWRFSPMGKLTILDRAVMDWQLDNQERVLAAMKAEQEQPHD